jgi:hypothetical protein
MNNIYSAWVRDKEGMLIKVAVVAHSIDTAFAKLKTEFPTETVDSVFAESYKLIIN